MTDVRASAVVSAPAFTPLPLAAAAGAAPRSMTAAVPTTVRAAAPNALPSTPRRLITPSELAGAFARLPSAPFNGADALVLGALVLGALVLGALVLGALVLGPLVLGPLVVTVPPISVVTRWRRSAFSSARSAHTASNSSNLAANASTWFEPVWAISTS